ncbi:MAG: 6-phosphofructokinase, partial [Candidatus Dadabacteria bacterium]|nr:6-phosphofructokinase [Candidatus Dadabacteria bacterium]
NPIPFDVDYTRKLGYCAVKYLLDGGGEGALVYVRTGKIQAIPFQELIDEKTNSIKVRYMDKNTEAYEVSQKYMIKLNRDDIETPPTLKKLSEQTNLSGGEFREYFAKIFR